MALDKIFVHKVCGGPVERELMYSDAERDYYQAVCYRCEVSVELKDMEFRDQRPLLPDETEVFRASGDHICDVCGKKLYDHARYRYPMEESGCLVKGCDERFYHL